MQGLIVWLKIRNGVFALLLPVAAFNQSLTLEKAHELARNNYPLIKQKDLIRQTSGLNINNLRKGFLPQLTISGQATYQSDCYKSRRSHSQHKNRSAR